MGRGSQWVGRGNLKGAADCSAGFGQSRPKVDALPCLRDRMRRPRFRTSPRTYPTGARRGQGLSELPSLKDATDAREVRGDVQ